MASRSQLKRQAEAAVRIWNARNPVGSAVVIVSDDVAYQMTTAGPAAVHDSHYPCVPLAGLSRPYPLHLTYPLSDRPIHESEVSL